MYRLESTESATPSDSFTAPVRSNRPAAPINIGLLKAQGQRGACHLARRLLSIQGWDITCLPRCAQSGHSRRRLVSIHGIDPWYGPRWPDCFRWLCFPTEARDLAYALRDLGLVGLAAAESVSGRQGSFCTTVNLPREKLVAMLEGESPLALGIAFADSPPEDNLDRYHKVSSEVMDKGVSNGGYCTLDEILSIVPPEYTPALLDRLFDQMEALDIAPLDDAEREAWLASHC